MKTVKFILFYMHMLALIWCLVALVWNTLTHDFATAVLDSILFTVNMIIIAMSDTYEEPKEQMYSFIDKYLK